MGEGREEEFGPELEMSAILCWIFPVCLPRSLSTLAYLIHGKISMDSLPSNFWLDSPSGDAWKEIGRRVRLEHLLHWFLPQEVILS